MKRVLIAYLSATGTTESMAEYIAEGIRISGQGVVVKRIKDIESVPDINGYDGYIFGSPTYSLDVPESMKTFMSIAEKASLEGKLGGAFGSYAHDVSYQHDNYAPAYILDSMQNTGKMLPFELGPLTLKEDVVSTSEGIRACHDYGKIFGEKLAG